MAGVDKYTKLLLHFDEEVFVDSSLLNHEIGMTSIARDSNYSVFGGYSANFDGDALAITANASSDFTFGSGDFTVDFWYRPGTKVSTYTAIVQNEISDTWVGGEWVFRERMPTYPTKFQFASYNLGELTSTTEVVVGTWYHLAFARHGSMAYFFIDGVLEASADWGTGSIDSGTERIIYAGGQPNGKLNGHIDELRISKGIARWTDDFDLPTEAYGPGVASGILTHDAKIIIIDEDSWEIQHMEDVSSGEYNIQVYSGEKTILARKSDGQIIAYGKVTL